MIEKWLSLLITIDNWLGWDNWLWSCLIMHPICLKDLKLIAIYTQTDWIQIKQFDILIKVTQVWLIVLINQISDFTLWCDIEISVLQYVREKYSSFAVLCGPILVSCCLLWHTDIGLPLTRANPLFLSALCLLILIIAWLLMRWLVLYMLSDWEIES